MPFVMRLYCFHIKYKSTYKNVIMSLVWWYLMRFHFHNAWIFMMCIHAVVTIMWTVLMMTTTNNYKRQCKNSTSENCVWHNFLSWTEITSMCKEFFITIFSSFISLSCHATHICMCFHLIHIWFYLLLLVMCTRKLFFKDQNFSTLSITINIDDDDLKEKEMTLIWKVLLVIKIIIIIIW